MEREQFLNDLPLQVTCECCRRSLPVGDWGMGRYGASDWMAIAVVKCDRCSWMKIAAAGSSEDAHREAQYTRLKLVVMMGL